MQQKKFYPLLFSLLIIANLAYIAYFWLHTSGPALLAGGNAALIALGRASGLYGAFLILLQFLLIGRIKWLEVWIGLDKLSRLHHYNGLLAIIFIILHPLLLLVGYAAVHNYTFTRQLIDFVLHWENVAQAIIGFLLLIGVVIISLHIVRQKLPYENWYFTHLLTYAAVILAFGHQLNVGTDLQYPPAAIYWWLLYVFVFGNFILFRFCQPLYQLWRRRFYVAAITRETADAISIYIKGKNLTRFKIAAGQFIIVRFLAKNYFWQAHPFSLSCAPNGRYLRLTIKQSGDFTRSLENLPVNTKALIDGPHGVFTARFARRKKFLFIAGGVGITPVFSLIEDLARQNITDIKLLYSNRSAQNIIFQKDLAELAQRYGIAVAHTITGDQSWSGERGEIDRAKLLRLAPDWLERETYLCGPKGMLRGLKQMLLAMGFPKQRLHYEEFSF